jgi:hypothetical protein
MSTVAELAGGLNYYFENKFTFVKREKTNSNDLNFQKILWVNSFLAFQLSKGLKN